MTTKTRAPRQTKRARLKKRMDAALLELAQVELIKDATSGAAEATYFFKHALVQDTAQSTLLHGEFKRLNRLVANAYESVYADRCMDEFAAVLAQYYEAAGDAAKTILYATRAGDQAARLYANPEAIAFYTKALDAAKTGAGTTAQLVYLYTKRGRAYEVMGSMEALTTYQEMSAFAQTRRDRALELQALLLRGKIHSSPSAAFNRTAALDLATQATTLALELGDRTAHAHALWNQQMLSLFSRELPLAIEYGEHAMALARQANAQELLGFIIGDLAGAYFQAGQIDKIPSLESEAIAIWRALDNKPMLADNLMQTAARSMLRGEYEAAIALTEEGIEISRASGSRVGVISNQSTQLSMRLERGEFERALQLAQANLHLAAEMGTTFDPPMHTAIAAWAYAHVGASEHAAQLADRTRARLKLPGAEFFRAWSWVILARYYLYNGDVPEAVAALAESRLDPTSGLADPGTMYGVIALGDCAMAQGEFANAFQMMSQRVTVLRNLGFHQSLPDALYIQANAARALGELAQAFELANQARMEAELAPTRRLLWQIYATLREMEMARGNLEQANRYQQQVREVLDFIVAHTPQEYRESFLNLPKVRAVMQEPIQA